MALITKIKAPFIKRRRGLIMANSTRYKQWFDGLKYAEEIGEIEAYEQLKRNEFLDDSQFEKGVMDYIHHAKNRLKGVINNG